MITSALVASSVPDTRLRLGLNSWEDKFMWHAGDAPYNGGAPCGSGGVAGAKVGGSCTNLAKVIKGIQSFSARMDYFFKDNLQPTHLNRVLEVHPQDSAGRGHALSAAPGGLPFDCAVHTGNNQPD